MRSRSASGKLKLNFHEKPIRFGEVRSEHGIPYQKALMTELVAKRKKGDTCFADISLRERGKLSMFNNAIVEDCRVAPTNTACAIVTRFCDGEKYSVHDYVATQTFPEDYDFMDQEVNYVKSIPSMIMWRHRRFRKIMISWIRKSIMFAG